MFLISRRFAKLTAMFLTTLMLIGNPAAIISASAATDSANSPQTAELPALNLDKPAGNELQVTQAAFNSDFSRLSTNQKAAQFLNQLIPYYLQNGKRQGPQWLRTTDINFSVTENYKPVFSLETIQPFSQTTKNSELLFWQGRYSYQSDDGTTSNLGIGWRKLSEDKTSILGFNAFYDYGFKHNLSRVGIGAEYFNKLAEYRTNFYFPVSGDRQIDEKISNDGILYTYIRAVQGLDYEVGSTLANAQWLGFYASGFYYDNKHNDDERGYKLRSTLQLSPRISMEMGYTKSNLSSGDLYGKIQYQLADKLGPSLFRNSHKDKKTNDISYKLLQKVQRENQIKTETFNKFIPYVGSVSTTVTNGSGQPIQGVRLQAYQNGNPVGSAVITNAAGVGVISGLDVGTYTIRATYFNYSNDSSTVTVQKDQMVNAAISLPVVGGNLVVNVFDAQGGSVSGATVTANVVSESSEHARAEGNLIDRILGVKTAFAAEAVFTLSMTTGTDGTAHFANLPPGNYRFTVQANGQSMNSIPATVPTNGGTSNVNVVLPSSNNTTGSAAITVTDGSSPLSGAAVTVTVNNTAQTVTTNSIGLATFSDMPAGSYTFSVSKEGYINNTVTVAINNGVTAAGKIVLAKQTGTITITITDGINTVSGATVTLNETTSETTDEMGQAIFASQPIGVSAYTVTAPGYDTKSGNITVNIAGSSETISLTRQTGATTITVTNGISPISGAAVSISGLGDWTVTTNELGQATFTNVPTGTYIFTVTKTGYSSNYTIVEVSHGSTASGTITTVRQSGNAVITVSEGSTPIQGASVSVTADGTEHTIITDSAGRALFNNLPTGSYSFTVTKTGYDITTCNATVVSSGLAAASVSLTRQTGSATITVNDGTTPLSGATISITVNGSVQTATTNESGQASFTSLPIGSYTVTLSKEGYKTATTTLTIANGQVTAGEVHLVKKLGDLLVGVRDTSTNSNLPAVTANLTGNGVNVTGTTDDYGVVIIPDLPDGTYSLTLTKSGYSSITVPVTVTNGERSFLSASMNPATGTITAIVYDTAYHTLPGLSVSTTINGTNVTIVTNSAGRAIFTNVPYGLYSITVSDGPLQYPSSQVMVSSLQPNPLMALTIDYDV